MKVRHHTDWGGKTIQDLYPKLTETERQQAEENLDRYVLLALRVYERIKGDPDAYAQFLALTARGRRSTIEHNESHPT